MDRQGGGRFPHRTAEFDAAESPNFDAVCFHAQQCAEKLFKAVLMRKGEVPPRTHDLAELSRRLEAVCTDWKQDLEPLRFLTIAAVDYRYPGELAGADEARRSLQICHNLRTMLQALLSIP